MLLFLNKIKEIANLVENKNNIEFFNAENKENNDIFQNMIEIENNKESYAIKKVKSDFHEKFKYVDAKLLLRDVCF